MNHMRRIIASEGITLDGYFSSGAVLLFYSADGARGREE